jgi:hypothetical protein
MLRGRAHCAPARTRLALAALVLAGCGGDVSGPPTAPASPAPARAALPVLRDGFEGDALAAFWRPGDHGTGRYAPGAVQLTDEHARGGRRSARITLSEGDVEQSGDAGQPNERAELDSGRRAILDRDSWCGWAFLLPRGFPIVDKRLVLAQWKQSELEGSALIAQRFRKGRHYLTVRDWDARGGEFREYELPPIEPGRWHDVIWRARFSRENDGIVEVWIDGELVVRHAGTTAGPGGKDSFYHKVGLYRDRWHEPMTIHVDSYALGGSFEDVDPARFPD